MHGPRPGKHRRRTAGSLGAVLAALAAVFILSPVSHGEEAPASGTKPAAADNVEQGGAQKAAEHTPVVFVHGYSGSSSNWASAKARFLAAGYSSDQLYAYDYDWKQSNRTSAEELSAYVDAVLRKTGADQVDVVNHSMGGLVSQYYLTKLDGDQKVAHLASLAGANHGTTSAGACTVYDSCREMLPGSDFVEDITSGDETPGETAYATWYSACDGVILPSDSTKLDGAENNNAGCVNHLVFLTDGSVQSGVIDFLES